MRVLVVGGGPAGMMAAIQAAKQGNAVTLLEQNEKLGKKLFITGKGRCNVTNDCDVTELFDSVVSNKKFLYSAFYSFSNQDVKDFFEEQGLRLKVERGRRVFPASDKSSDVIKALGNALKKLEVKIRLRTRVDKVLTESSESNPNRVSASTRSSIHKIESNSSSSKKLVFSSISPSSFSAISLMIWITDSFISPISAPYPLLSIGLK